jgi:21S rRNA (GM2251-2'-O)-methyltransferase
MNVPVKELDRWTLNDLADQAVHQGVCLDAEPVKFEPVRTVRDAGGDALPSILRANTSKWNTDDNSESEQGPASPVVLALDEVQDARNLGALLRTALYMGCAGVVCASKNCAPPSPAVARASAGALDVLAAEGRLFSAQQLPGLLDAMRQDGWRILGAHAGSSASRPAELIARGPPTAAASLEDGVVRTDKDSRLGPTVLVLGNEHRGMRTLVRRSCSDLVTVPRGTAPVAGKDTDPAASDSVNATKRKRARIQVDSLNVGVAAGILLGEVRDLA